MNVLAINHHEFLDRVGEKWQRCGDFIAARPLQVLGGFIACAVVIIVLSLELGTRRNIDNVKNSLCSGPTGIQADQCQKLFSNLLEHPTTEQAARLRQIVRGTP